VVHEIVRRAPAGPAESFRHLSESLGFDEVVEGKRRKHGAVAVDFCLDEQCGTAHAVEVDEGLGIAFCLCGYSVSVIFSYREKF